MPRGGPSRNRRVRSNSDQDEDMADGTQNRVNGTQNGNRGADPEDQDQEEDEDDEEDEDQQQRPATRSAREIVADLKPQPLDRHSEQTLKALTSNYANLSKFMHDNLTQLRDAVVASEDQRTEFVAEDDQVFKYSDTEARELLDMIAEAQSRQKAFKEIQSKLSRGEEIRNVNDLYSEMVEKSRASYATKTSRQKYLKSEAYEEFRNAIWEPRRDERGPMPSLAELIPQEDGDEDDSDDDIRVGGVSRDYKCPITTSLLENPVTNMNCKHSYSKAAIMELINSKEKRCPVSGCAKEVSKSSLKEDKALNKAVQQHRRRMQAKEESKRATQAAGADLID